MENTDKEDQIEALAQKWHAEEIQNNKRQAENHGWDEPLPLSWTLDQQRMRARNTLIQSAAMKEDARRQEAYRRKYGHYPKQSIIGQGR